VAHPIGTFYVAPATQPDDEWACGYDGNVFASADEAEAEIHALAAALGGEPTDYVVCRRGGSDQPEGWRVYHSSQAGSPRSHGAAAGYDGEWHYQPVDHAGDVWSLGYSTRAQALAACLHEIQQTADEEA